MMYVFKVTIKYKNGETCLHNVTATYDVEAREKAVRHDQQLFKDAGYEPPKVDYCEITLLAKLD